MDKKKISIIVVSVIVLLVIGLGFNNLFSKANKINNISASNSSDINNSSKVQDNNEENKDEALENEETSDEVEGKDESNKEAVTEQSVVDSQEDNSNSNITSNDSSITPDNPIENDNGTNGNINEGNNNTIIEENKPTIPVEPEIVKETVTISISCNTAINSGLNSTAGFTHLPSDGMILYTTKVEINEGDTVFNILQRITKQNGIHMEYTGSGSTTYIQGINNLYEFDGGQSSGWMYSVNGWYPNYGCGSYTVKANDVIQWNYTLDLGNDLGAGRN